MGPYVLGSFCAGLLCDGSFCDGTLCRGNVNQDSTEKALLIIGRKKGLEQKGRKKNGEKYDNFLLMKVKKSVRETELCKNSRIM
jgi:hypothetical protein